MRSGKMKWLAIPVVMVLVLVLSAGAAFAAYNFFSVTTSVFVDEPLTVDYNLRGDYGGDADWHPLGNWDSKTLELSAGDSFAMDVRITNLADNALTVSTSITGDIGWFTFGGFPDGTGDNCSHGKTLFPVTIDVSGSAPAPITYDVTFSFYRS